MQHGARPRRENGLDMLDLQTLANTCHALYLPYKEGVAGSNLASPISKFPANSGICGLKRGPERAAGLLSLRYLFSGLPRRGVLGNSERIFDDSLRTCSNLLC